MTPYPPPVRIFGRFRVVLKFGRSSIGVRTRGEIKGGVALVFSPVSSWWMNLGMEREEEAAAPCGVPSRSHVLAMRLVQRKLKALHGLPAGSGGGGRRKDGGVRHTLFAKELCADPAVRRAALAPGVPADFLTVASFRTASRRMLHGDGFAFTELATLTSRLAASAGVKRTLCEVADTDLEDQALSEAADYLQKQSHSWFFSPPVSSFSLLLYHALNHHSTAATTPSLLLGRPSRTTPRR